MNKYIFNDRGQILAEVVIAIGVIVVVLVGMSSLMTRTTKTVRQNSNKDVAVGLVQSQISDYKRQRDTDSTAFFAALPLSSPCVWVAVPPVSPTFTCTVTSTNIAGGVNITVTATWTESTNNDSNISLTQSLMQL